MWAGGTLRAGPTGASAPWVIVQHRGTAAGGADGAAPGAPPGLGPDGVLGRAESAAPVPAASGVAADGSERIPPGQYLADGWPVMHYGRPPTFRPESWDFQVLGATLDGGSTRWTYDDFRALPKSDVVADFHCVTKFTMLDNTWTGVLAATIVAAAPPDPEVSHVLVWADRGYTTNLRLSDLLRPSTVFAHERDGEALSVDHGWPLRLVVPHLYGWKGPKWVRGLEYLTADRRGFWEARGYHNVGDPWREQRYTYQERPGDGPERSAVHEP